VKLVIFTPVIKISAIGSMSSLITRTLVSQGHEVVVVRTESPGFYEEDVHDFNVEQTSWGNMVKVFKYIREADILVYQIGNNYGFHQGSLEWLPGYSGIVCLHEFFIGHLFYDWAQSNYQHAYKILRHWYDEEVAQRFFDEGSGDAFTERTCDVSPMTEWICSMASGVVTHSSWGINRVLNSCPGPVYRVPLACDVPYYIPDKSTSLFCSTQFTTAENYAQKITECASLSNKANPVIAAANYFAKVMYGWGAADELYVLENTINPLRIFEDT